MKFWKPRVPAVLLLLLTASCTSLRGPTLERVRDGSVDPCHAVFICPGMLKDLGSRWGYDMRQDLEEAGVLAYYVRYWSDPLGVWFNWGSKAPARLMTRTAADLAREHERSGCRRPLRIDLVGFSSGCEAIIDCLRSDAAPSFGKVVFIHSSAFALSRSVDRMLAEGRMTHVTNYWSPIDGTTLLAPLGSGALPLKSCSGRVENKVTWLPHLAHLTPSFLKKGILEALLAPSEPETAHQGAEPPAAPAYRTAVIGLLEAQESE